LIAAAAFGANCKRKGKEAMSFNIELELQKLPKVIALKDGTNATLRPLRRDDEKDFHQLFLDIPEPERMFIKHRITEIEVIRDWCQNLDYGRNLPLVALIGGKIVGDATLHQQLGGWRRHIGRVSVLVHPQHRGRGLASALVSEIVDIARKRSRRNSSANRRGRSRCSPCSASASFCAWKITSRTCRPHRTITSSWDWN
jgi:GNAT superfamily N-acetyltransferase